MTCCLICCSIISAAQDEKAPEKGKSYGKASMEFINNSVYLGRKDSVTTPYLTPSLGYYDKSGFYIVGSLSYLPRSGSNRIDESAIGAGYDFSLGNFEGEIGAEKLFYNQNSTNVKSEVKGDISVTATYDFGFIETSLQPGINFGSKSDYSLGWGVDHGFSVADDKLTITPSFLLNGSTRNFYGSYYGKRRFKKKNGNGGGPTISASVQDASSFKLMDYEWSLPFSYSVKKFTFSFTPDYAIPTNPAVVTIVTKPVVGPTVTKTMTEKTENIFYFSFDVEIKF
jgi:hypothetical protein